MNMALKTLARESAAFVGYVPGERDRRPWGSWEVLATGPRYTVKRIVVLPGHRLSLQYHNHRAEHWTVVSGRAEVEIDDVISSLHRGQDIYIPMRARHHVRNIGNEPLVFIEVQVGDLLDEMDIVRLFDDYGRHDPALVDAV